MFCFYKRRKFKHTLNIHPSDTAYQEFTHVHGDQEIVDGAQHVAYSMIESNHFVGIYDIITEENMRASGPDTTEKRHPLAGSREHTMASIVYDTITNVQQTPDKRNEPLYNTLNHTLTTHPSQQGDTTHAPQQSKARTSDADSSELEVPYDTLQYTMKNRTSQETHTPVDSQGVYDKINTTPQALYSTLDVPGTIQHRIMNGCKYTVVTKHKASSTTDNHTSGAITSEGTGTAAEGTAEGTTAEGTTAEGTTAEGTTAESTAEGTTAEGTNTTAKGITEGITEGTGESITEGTTEGTGESITEGTTEGTGESITEGTTEGTGESITEGTTEGTGESITEGTTEGTGESITEGTTEGTGESITEVTTEGTGESITTEGTCESITEVTTEGTGESITTEGTCESITEVTTEGTGESITEGTDEDTTECTIYC